MKNKSSIIKQHAKENQQPLTDLEINQSVKSNDFSGFAKSMLSGFKGCSKTTKL